MRKMFKAAASLAVGCAMLSTSAFAALTGTPALSDDNSAVNVTVSGVGADKESTILVLKGALTEMPATINDDDIVYIYQKTAAADGTATYSMPLGTRVGDAKAVTVFAGATDEVAAARLGSVTLASEPDRDFITAADTTKAKLIVTNVATGGLFTGISSKVSVALDTTAYPNVEDNTEAATKDTYATRPAYTLKVVDTEGNVIESAEIYYSAQANKYYALIPTDITDYKFEVVAGTNSNEAMGLFGDVNADGKIITTDATILAGIINGKNKNATFTSSNLRKLRLDFNGDGKLNGTDKTILSGYIAKKHSNIPATTK